MYWRRQRRKVDDVPTRLVDALVLVSIGSIFAFDNNHDNACHVGIAINMIKGKIYPELLATTFSVMMF